MVLKLFFISGEEIFCSDRLLLGTVNNKSRTALIKTDVPVVVCVRTEIIPPVSPMALPSGYLLKFY